MPHEKQTTGKFNSLRSNGKRVAAAALASMAAGSELAQPASAQPPTPTIHALKAEGKLPQPLEHLRKINQLPGYGQKVSPELRQELQNSVVQIVVGTRADPITGVQSDTWSENCTGTKISVPGNPEPYVFTSAHCFEAVTGYPTGIFDDPFAPQVKAENFVNVGGVGYAIEDPSIQPGGNFTGSIGTVDGLSVNTHYRDVALLHVAEPLKGGGFERSYDSIPAISAERFLGPRPEPGMEMALFGMPQAAGDTPVVGKGYYIGRVKVDTREIAPGKWATREVDIVGIDPATPAADNCNFGTSGSIAMAANGTVTGSLSLRYNYGYGPGHSQYEQPQDTTYDSRAFYTYVENVTGIDVKHFSTLCGYNPMYENTIPNLEAGLNNQPAEGGKGPVPIVSN